MDSKVTRQNPTTLPDVSAVGYSQISIASPGRMAFVSGQVASAIGVDAVPSGLAEQTAIVVANLSKALDALGASNHDIVQIRIYVTDIQPERVAIAMQQVGVFLNGVRPSLTGIGVTALASPDFQIEIEMVVCLPD